MSEDDLFRILGRTPVNELIQLRSRWQRDQSDNRPWYSVLKANGWTWDEYNDLYDDVGEAD